jgi:O-antigen/teichoic acid export membrane protein
LQLCGATAFGFDQLVVSTLLSPSEAASFSAHSRFFQIGAAFLTVAIASVWPPISAAISRSDFAGARQTYARAVIVVSVAAVCWTVPMLSGLVRVSLFKSGEQNHLGLILPMALWFVLWQVGVLIGQVQAALRDLKYLVKIGCLMAATNVFLSVLLCLQFGAVGVVWGSIISYPIIVLIPTLRRLGKSSFWKSAL